MYQRTFTDEWRNEWLNEQAHSAVMIYMLKKRKIMFLPWGGNIIPCLTLNPCSFYPTPSLWPRSQYFRNCSKHQAHLSKHEMPLSLPSTFCNIVHPVKLQLNSTLCTMSSGSNQYPSDSLGTLKVSLSILPINHTHPYIVI